MAQQNINIGTQDAKAGDTLFDAFTKVEANTTELYGKVNAVDGTDPAAPAGSIFVSDGAGGGEFIRVNGFGQYADDRNAVGTPSQTLSPSTRTQWVCNGLATTIEKDPSDLVNPMWNVTTNKVEPISEFDVYNLRVSFKVQNYSGATPYITFDLDIGGTQGVIVDDTKALVKGGAEQRILLDFEVFAGSTFIANGGQINLTYVGGGTCDVYDPQILVRRVMKNYV